MSTPAAAAAPPAVATAAPPVAAPAAPRCDNCGASVAGRYCGSCGQRFEPPVHSLGHFLTVAFEDVTHADSRLWRTLVALLFKPGFLTHEFLTGRRARYLPPVRLYLVVSVVFFLWIAATPHESGFSGYSAESQAEIRQAARELAQAQQAGGPAAANAARAAAVLDAASGGGGGPRCNLDYEGPWKQTVGPALRRGCENAVRDNGRALSVAFFHSLPRAMFLFLPLLAAAMMLFYWRPRHYYVEHLLFFVHNHAAGFLLLLLAGVAAALLPVAGPLIWLVTTGYIAWYVYRAMRVVYGQGRGLTLLKLVCLGFIYLVLGAIMTAVTALYSLLAA